jgi:hypothetical protein
MPETDLLDSPKQADSKLSSIGAPPKQPDTRGPLPEVRKHVSDIFGARRKSGGPSQEPRRAHADPASEETVRHARNDDFVVTEVGQIEVKGFGRMLLHLIEDESACGKAGP